VKILVINPNITDSVTALIRAEALRSASPGTEITVLTAPFGVAYIETRAEALIGAYATLQLAAEHYAAHDAVVVAAFGDPGLAGLREILPCPVTGLSEAALASACLLGQRFSIVAISRRIKAWYIETVEHNGLASRLASVRSLDEPLADIGTVQNDQASKLVALANACVDQDGADSIILGGAPLAGLARQVAEQLPVPVVDGVGSAIRHAEGLIRMNPRKARKGSFSAPPKKDHRGLPAAIAQLLER
jgi:allantoin racemase